MDYISSGTTITGTAKLESTFETTRSSSWDYDGRLCSTDPSSYSVPALAAKPASSLFILGLPVVVLSTQRNGSKSI
jgi:hypothetical protein